VHGQARGHVARLNPDGSTDRSFLNGLTNVNNVITALAIQSDGKILVGGTVDPEGNTGPLARLNPDGTVDPSFQSALRPLWGDVTAILIQQSGKILVSGNIVLSGSDNGKGVLRLNTDGSFDDTFATPIASNMFVHCMAEQNDGKILIGGVFSVGRLNADGTADNSFGENQPPSGTVYSINIQGDGKILIAGGFDTVGGIPRNGLARLNSDGTLDDSFAGAFPGVLNRSHSMIIENGGTILVT